MASLNNLFFSPVVTPQRRVAVRAPATGKGGTRGGTRGSVPPAAEEKGILDFILGALTKQEQFYETDPIFSKDAEEEKSGAGGTTTARRKNSAAPPPPPKKNGGFGLGPLGGLFAKK